MSDLPDELYARYKKEANEHADFLCEKVFKPAFVMAYLHGAKHMRDELLSTRKGQETTAKTK